jgi:hypothetical protein
MAVKSTPPAHVRGGGQREKRIVTSDRIETYGDGCLTDSEVPQKHSRSTFQLFFAVTCLLSGCYILAQLLADLGTWQHLRAHLCAVKELGSAKISSSRRTAPLELAPFLGKQSAERFPSKRSGKPPIEGSLSPVVGGESYHATAVGELRPRGSTSSMSRPNPLYNKCKAAGGDVCDSRVGSDRTSAFGPEHSLTGYFFPKAEHMAHSSTGDPYSCIPADPAGLRSAAIVISPSSSTPCPPEPPGVIGPWISEQEWHRALQALDLCLQDYAWHAGDNYLQRDSVYRALHAKGITLAVIESLLGHLIQRNVFRPYCHTVLAGYSIEGGMRVFRSEAEVTHCLITTREQWYRYLEETRRATTQPATSDRTDLGNPYPERLHIAVDEEAPVASASRGPGGGIPGSAPRAANVVDPSSTTPAASPTDNAGLEFLEFSCKQRLLLRALRGKDQLAIPEVMRAVYGTTQTPMSTLERLLGRTNKNLTHRGYRLEIKRKANTLSLQPV